jgi:hypothetical protein
MNRPPKSIIGIIIKPVVAAAVSADSKMLETKYPMLLPTKVATNTFAYHKKKFSVVKVISPIDQNIERVMMDTIKKFTGTSSKVLARK